MLTELLGFMTEVRFADAESLVALRKAVEEAGVSDGLSVGERKLLLAAEVFVLDAIRRKRNGNQGHDQAS